MEHGRHHPDRRLLRPRAAERDLVLPRDGDRLRPRRARHRQLLDDGGDARRGLRRARPAGRSRSGHRGRGRHLGRLLRRQDDAGLGDDGPRAVHGRRRDDQSAHRRDDLDVRARGRDRHRPVHHPRPDDAGYGPGLRYGERTGDACRRVLDRPPQPAADGPARHLLDPARPAVPGDLQLRAVRGGPGVVHPAGTRGRVRRQARPGIAAHGDRGDLRGDGERLRVRHWQRDDRCPVLARRDGRHADDDLAHPRGAELRRDHGGGRLPRSADQADRGSMRSRPGDSSRPSSARASA